MTITTQPWRALSRGIALAAAACACASPPDSGPALTPGEALRAVPADLYEKPGFEVEERDGRLLVRRLSAPATTKGVTVIGAGPLGCTIEAPDRQTVLEYVAAKPGFEVAIEDEQIVALRHGQQRAEEEFALAGAGPCGLTVRAPDRDTALAYVATMPGFDVEVASGRAWVFEAGEPHDRGAARTTRRRAGPLQMTVRAVDSDTIDRYLAVCAQLAR